MIWVLLGAHVVVAAALMALGRRLGRNVFLVGAIAPAAALIWGLSLLGAGTPPEAEVAWVEGLDIVLRFRVDDLALLMTLVVGGIGALVFVYAAGYASVGDKGSTRLAVTLLAFTAAMLGLVWADSVWALFLCWEATSVTSFLLVGHKREDPDAQRAARRALVITAAGGLALLAAFVLLVDAAGTPDLSAMGPLSGTSVSVAAVLVMVAVATKSAQVPFHVWLPGAMAAPTPVSAYLHSATMVKAGVVLVAVTAPILGGVGAWSNVGLSLGLASMIWGAVGALRHVDAKLILAWGTVSQLGLMVALLSLGEAKAAFAAISIVAAHAVFKAALFMVVGEIDVRTGTRDITQLGGLHRSMPLATVAAVAAGASMAGLPPFLGFAAKEAAIEAVLGLDGAEKAVVATLVVLGAVLTVAYTARLLVGLFGPGPDTDVTPARWAMSAPSTLLALIGFAGFVVVGAVNDVVRPAAIDVDGGASAYSLLRWPGLTGGLVTSMAVIAVGLPLGVALGRRIAGREGPAPVGANMSDKAIDGTVLVARRIASRVQHGSLPLYVATMGLTVAAASVPFAGSIDVSALYGWDSRLQPLVGLVVVLCAAGAALVGSRLGAALGLGVVGVGVAALFLLQGAPDLALTQLMVETVVVVGFVLGLGHLTRQFPPVGIIWRGARLAVAGVVGAAVAVALASAASAPSGQPAVAELTAGAVDEGGGNNIVNVILTDIRALDTLGEIVVLFVVGLGIVALARGRSVERDGEAS